MDQVRKLLSISEEIQREARDSCRKTLSTIFTNILGNPGELKFRKIREENEVLKKSLFGFENAKDILEIAGFERTGAKAAAGPSWVFMAAPEDEESMNVLVGVLQAINNFNPHNEDQLKVQVLNDDDANNHTTNNNNNNTHQFTQPRNSSDVVPSHLLAAAREAFGLPQQQHQQQQNHHRVSEDASAGNDDNDDDDQQQQHRRQEQQDREHMTLAPKFFSFARSVGFQMRMEALKDKQHKQHEDTSVLASFIVELLLDTRNADVISEALRIIRVLIDNMRRDPADAKFRLLKYDNPVLGKNFFPVFGAPELFIGILGFSLSDEGLAKERKVSRDDNDNDDDANNNEEESSQVSQVAQILARVEEGLKLRRQLENDERRRLAAEEMRSELEAERRRQGGTKTNKPNGNGNDDDDDDSEQKKKPRRMIPISQAVNYLLGKPLEED